MNESRERRACSLDLAQLRDRFPDYEFERDPRRDPPRYTATARDLAIRPHALVTDDLAELERELAVAAGRE